MLNWLQRLSPLPSGLGHMSTWKVMEDGFWLVRMSAVYNPARHYKRPRHLPQFQLWSWGRRAKYGGFAAPLSLALCANDDSCHRRTKTNTPSRYSALGLIYTRPFSQRTLASSANHNWILPILTYLTGPRLSALFSTLYGMCCTSGELNLIFCLILVSINLYIV